ncbi:MAG: hypothetical protein FJ404_15010 [Verrucomicrobia bacterium]|nr:hypothetical protein [Verrucomicrobiota bacterium]
MKQVLNRWIANHARVPGVLACGLHYPDRTVFSQSMNVAYPPIVLDPVWRCLADTFSVFHHHRIPSEFVRWQYQDAHLYAAIRSDNICCGIFVVQDADTSVHATLRRLLREFKAIPATSSAPVQSGLAASAGGGR